MSDDYIDIDGFLANLDAFGRDESDARLAEFCRTSARAIRQADRLGERQMGRYYRMVGFVVELRELAGEMRDGDAADIWARVLDKANQALRATGVILRDQGPHKDNPDQMRAALLLTREVLQQGGNIDTFIAGNGPTIGDIIKQALGEE